MSETTNETPVEAGPETQTEAPAAKRERTVYPIRLLRESDGAFGKPEGPTFNTIEQAERHILAEGEPGVTYMLARVIGARRRPRPQLEDVTL